MSIDDNIRQIIREELALQLSPLLKKLDKIISSEEDGQLITRFEMAKNLHVSLPTLNRWEKLGILIPTRIGSKVFYPKNIKHPKSKN